jgi:chromate transporter
MSNFPEKRPLLTLALLFLRIGILGFGGALANMALMEQAWVKHHKWLTQAQYLEGVALSYLLPGPTAVLLSVYLGSRRGKILGGVVSGLSFIAPAVVLTFALSWIYFQYHTIPVISALFAGLGPVVVAFILAMLYRYGKTALTSVSRSCLGLAVGVLLVFPVLPQAWNLITLLLLSGLVGTFCFRERTMMVGSSSLIVVSGMAALVREAAFSLSPSLFVLVPLALMFLKASVLMFGGGVVALPLFQQELVQTHHWLTEQQFLDGVAIGQLTPGPITVVATFAGYAVAGTPGAIVATVAMYVPPFVLMLSSTPLLLHLRHSATVQGMLQGIMAGALGMMGATAFLLGRAAIIDLWTGGIALVSLVLLLRWNVSPTYVILGVALLGLLRLLFSLP